MAEFSGIVAELKRNSGRFDRNTHLETLLEILFFTDMKKILFKHTYDMF